MGLTDYEHFVLQGTKRGEWQMGGLGIAGEAGEVADHIKKAMYHDGGPTLEGNQALLLELGDVLWYVTFLALKAGFSLEDVFEANITKLVNRYPERHPDLVASYKEVIDGPTE